MSVSKPRKYFAALVAGILVAGACLLFFVDTRIENQRVIRECEANLKTIWKAMEIYMFASPGERFPPLAHDAGRLMFDAESMFSDLLHDSTVFVSPAHPDASKLLKNRIDFPALIDDHSYYYLGYMILHDRSFKLFTEDYKIWIESGRPIPELNEIYPEYSDAIEQRREIRQKEYEAMIAELQARGGDPRYVKWNSAIYIGEDERNLRYRLREGVARFLVTDIGDPRAYIRQQARVPVLIERPELHGDGGHVLFMDGHVEFIPYPGKFPMTEEYIAGLRALDTLGSSESANE
jgi:prepilin-type processing-associated H-X9-DG protein